MRNPRDFLKPLAIGAPDPLREIPFKPARMIHFLDFSNEKMVAKAPDIAPKVDILLGNLEDAVPVDRKEAAREGLIRVGRDMELGETALWTRINALESPWVLDDLTEIVAAIGDRIEVVMVPKVEGPWDIHYVDRLLAQLEAKAGLERPILVHAILETAQGSHQPRGDRHGQPEDAGHELRARRPGRQPAHEDHARGRRSSRLPGDRGPRRRRPRGAAGDRPAGPLALLDRAHGRRVRRRGDPPLLRPPTATSRTSTAARRSSGPHSSSVASAPGHCTPSRSTSPRRSSPRTRTRCASRRR